MEIKIECGCGTKYKFDAEPVNGRMPVQVSCPNCGNDGTTDANLFISRRVPSAPAASARPVPTAIRVAAPAPSAAYHLTASAAPPPAAPASLLERTVFFVKERVALLKLTDTYDILDPATGHTIGIAKEEPPGWAKWLRLVIKKHRMPTALNIYEIEGQPPLLTVRRGFTFLRAKLHVTAADGRKIGYFCSKLLTLGGGFFVFDTADHQVAEVKGDWKGWNFRFLNKSGRELGTVTKKWAGLGKELFTSADNYIIALTDQSDARPDTSALLLAAGLCIDVVFKENE
jgi:uncharacterized protein YxjI